MHHLVLDPRDRRTLLMAARTGHLGPTVFRSTDLGASFKEVSRPPAFPKASEGETGRVVDHVFWLEPGHASEPGVWYAGTSPEGLFRSEDGGESWELVPGFDQHPMGFDWTIVDPKQSTPDGPILHSITIDPRDARHLYIGISGNDGGVFETTDKGASWKPLNAGSLAPASPEPYPEYGQDPHCLRLHPLAPDVAVSAEPLRDLSHRSVRLRVGSGSARTCPRRSATSASRSSCTRAIRAPSGCFRWTAPTSGRARARTESRPST